MKLAEARRDARVIVNESTHASMVDVVAACLMVLFNQVPTNRCDFADMERDWNRLADALDRRPAEW